MPAQPSPEGEPERAAEPEPAAAPAAGRVGVELRVELGTLLGLDDHPGEIAGWGPIPAPVARDLAETQRHGEWRLAVTDDQGGCCSTASPATAPTTTPPQRPIEQDPSARFPGRPLRRHSQIRHRTCLVPGCRRPATQADQDLRHEHARGGPTIADNLAPGCRHDHRLKTTGGWRLIKRDHDTYLWISPLGRKHLVDIDPITPPLPGPLPRTSDPDPPPF
ncbi:MAG TPA: HNH endonuclease signature motif containing protein [Jatrophihabitans sp.]|nr:HNH endonuclease signature motif containing protein [Jatrophihabitans sp.]